LPQSETHSIIPIGSNTRIPFVPPGPSPCGVCFPAPIGGLGAVRIPKPTPPRPPVCPSSLHVGGLDLPLPGSGASSRSRCSRVPGKDRRPSATAYILLWVPEPRSPQSRRWVHPLPPSPSLLRPPTGPSRRCFRRSVANRLYCSLPSPRPPPHPSSASTRSIICCDVIPLQSARGQATVACKVNGPMDRAPCCGV
jgi:hypothetical protein